MHDVAHWAWWPDVRAPLGLLSCLLSCQSLHFPVSFFIKDVPDMIEIADDRRDIYSLAAFTPTSVILWKGAQEVDVREGKRAGDRAGKAASNAGVDRQQLNGPEPVGTRTVRLKTVRTVRF